ALRDIIEEAGRAGILVVASAGNEGADTDVHPHFPSSFDAPNIVSVAATDNTDARPEWSNFGRTTVDVGAPGNRVVSTVPTSGPLSSPTGVAFFSGTSMAAPHISGLAALAFS